ncbi:TonB-dependent receptor [Pustulibacterium marinum]|uniref:TonB-dependent receptor n=1 Tax=Pustulibacterium marinum TaxID=1224947 RepID=A0A1I7EWH1_9FLAO|nr:TonB-dependent receptor [Pustulibacterium marinum]SFU28257.1 TonB-dependent receptor [Pustulibacterium marinum]
MKLTTTLKITFVTWIVALFTGFAQPGNGNIHGTITDDYGIYVPGASVMITSLDRGEVSDQDGEFTFVNIPAGSYTVTVKYLGFKNTEVTVEVTTGKTAALDIVLSSENVELEEVEVIGYGLGGQARALNTQKNNTNITNVVSTEQIGKFPDANIGDAVKRIPGITMQVDQGEARNIIVRGLAPQLNSVTLNGSRIPSAEGDNRNVQMDLIPSDMIQTIQVSKAVTPDMDADALGGSVNLITRSSPKDFRLSATAGSGISFITDKRILNGSFLVGDRTKNGKFGWMLAASYNDKDFGSDDIEAEWSNEFEYNNGDADNLESVDVNPYNSTFENRTYLVQRIRRSFSANFDYSFDDNNKVYFKSMYNWRDDRENRYRVEYEILDGEDIGPDDFTIENGNLTMFPAESKRQTKGGISNDRNKSRRLEDQRMQNYTVGGDHLFGSLKFNWLASYSKASEERLNERYIEYESEFTVNRGIDGEFPIYTPVNAADAALENYEFGEITEENQYTDEKDINFFANFELPANFFGQGEGIFKFGARGRFKKKERQNGFNAFEPTSGMETMADVATKDYSDANYLAGSQYQAGSFVTAEYLGGLNLFNTDQFDMFNVPSEYLGSNFDVSENVIAGYVMANQKLSDKLDVLFGVRVENTSVESNGNSYDPDAVDDAAENGEDYLSLVSNNAADASYTNILPGVHFKYNASDKTVLRFAWTNTLARPNYVDMAPFVETVSDDEEIVLGNPDLDPTTSMNFDFMAEHYYQSVGILSGGVFYKRLKDFIYTNVYNDANGFEVYQPFNGDNATIYGAEISFQRQLDFLPGFAKNFGIYTNYTYLHSEAQGIRNEDGDIRGDMDLPGSTPNMFNASLSYSDKKFNARLSANFSDAYLDELGGNDFEDRYYDKQFFVDFNATYSINKNLSLYATLNNITNQPLRYYQGRSNQTMQAEYYERVLTFGLKYDIY